MSFPTFISLRYLKSRKGSWFLSFMSFISLGGIIISVAGFFVIHSVMNGFSSHLRDALIGFNAHLVVPSPTTSEETDQLEKWLNHQREINQFRRIAEFDGIASAPSGQAAGARIRGIEKEEGEVYFFGEENWEDLKKSDDQLPGVLIGEELYTRLRFYPGDEELLTLIFPFGEVGPTGEVEPRKRNYRVIGIFTTGFYDVDAKTLFVDKTEAHILSGDRQGLKDRYLVTLNSAEKAIKLKQEILADFPNLKPTTWVEQNSRLFSALKLERSGMILLLSIVALIACFNVLGLITLLGLAKVRDLALLKALGLSRREAESIFERIGWFLGGIGSLLGLAIGAVVVYLLGRYSLPLPPAYYLDFLPVKVDWKVVLFFGLLVPVITWLASWWPARSVSRLNPVEILRST